METPTAEQRSLHQLHADLEGARDDARDAMIDLTRDQIVRITGAKLDEEQDIEVRVALDYLIRYAPQFPS